MEIILITIFIIILVLLYFYSNKRIEPNNIDNTKPTITNNQINNDDDFADYINVEPIPDAENRKFRKS